VVALEKKRGGARARRPVALCRYQDARRLSCDDEEKTEPLEPSELVITAPIVAVPIIVRATAVRRFLIVRASARAYLIHLDKIAIVVDVDVVADASLAGIKAVGQAGSLNANIIVPAAM